MPFMQGQVVRKPSKPEWGLGTVINSSEERVEVDFEQAGFKKLCTELAGLELVEEVGAAESGAERRARHPDIAEARRLCRSFISELSENRKGHDDAGMAKCILHDLDRHGDLTRTTRRRLSRWCTTDGNVFQRGAPIACEISLALYGRVLTRE